MIGDPRWLEAARERAQRGEVGAVERVARTDRQRHAMHHNRILRAHGLEHFQRPPALDHKVFGNDLEPVHPPTFVRRTVAPWTPLEDARVVRPPQPNTESEWGEIRPIHRQAVSMREADSTDDERGADRPTALRTRPSRSAERDTKLTSGWSELFPAYRPCRCRPWPTRISPSPCPCTSSGPCSYCSHSCTSSGPCSYCHRRTSRWLGWWNSPRSFARALAWSETSHQPPLPKSHP